MSLTAEQLEARDTGLGGTDAAVVAGCHPYKTARELYEEKTGGIVPEDISDKDAVYWGNVLEDTVAQEYARRTGYKVRRVNQTLKHPEHPFILGHIDRDVACTDRALECKTAGAFFNRDAWGESGTDQVPEHYLLQVQHYMGLLPKVNVFDLAVLIGGRDFRIYHIPRDQGLIDALTRLEVKFWRDVEAKNAPDFDYHHDTTRDLIAKLYPGTDGGIVTLPREAVFYLKTMEHAQEKAKQYAGIIDGAKAHLQALCGTAAVGLLPDGSGAGFTRKKIERKGYAVETSSYIDFRFSKKPKGV